MATKIMRIISLILVLNLAPLLINNLSPAEVDIDKIYKRGVELMELGRYGLAAMYFLEAGSRKSNYVEPYYQAGLCYMKLREFRNARCNFLMASYYTKDEKFSNDIKKMLDLTDEEMKKEELETKKKINEKILYESSSRGKALTDREMQDRKIELQAEYEKELTGKVLDEYSYCFRNCEITVKRLKFSISKEKGLEFPEGVIVTRVSSPLPFYDKDFFTQNDIIKNIGGYEILDLDDFMKSEVLQKLTELQEMKLIREKQEYSLIPSDELKTFLNAIDELKKGEILGAINLFSLVSDGASQYKNVSKLYVALTMTLYLDEELEELLRAKLNFKTQNFENDIVKLVQLTSEGTLLKPYNEIQKNLSDFVIGLSTFPDKPTSLDYDKYSHDIAYFSSKLSDWGKYLNNVKSETQNLYKSIDGQLKDRTNFVKSQYDFLARFNILLIKLDEWHLCVNQNSISDNIVLADDSFSKKIRDLPFLKSSKETKNIYSIDKNSFQDWLKISLKKYIEGSGNLYTTSQLRAFSEGLMKLSSDMRESEEFKSLEKTFKENQGLFSEAPVPEQVRDVNQSFKTANELISKLKKSPYATPEEKSSYDRMQTVNDQFASDFGIVFSKIIDICMANPYEYLSKTVISLNKLGSENDGIIKKIEDIENNLKKSPLYNYIIENPSISI